MQMEVANLTSNFTLKDNFRMKSSTRKSGTKMNRLSGKLYQSIITTHYMSQNYQFHRLKLSMTLKKWLKEQADLQSAYVSMMYSRRHKMIGSL